jgi:hypothetical protein
MSAETGNFLNSLGGRFKKDFTCLHGECLQVGDLRFTPPVNINCRQKGHRAVLFFLKCLYVEGALGGLLFIQQHNCIMHGRDLFRDGVGVRVRVLWSNIITNVLFVRSNKGMAHHEQVASLHLKIKCRSRLTLWLQFTSCLTQILTQMFEKRITDGWEISNTMRGQDI